MVLRSSMVHIITFRGMFNTHILCLWLLKNMYLDSKTIITEKNYDSEMVKTKRKISDTSAYCKDCCYILRFIQDYITLTHFQLFVLKDVQDSWCSIHWIKKIIVSIKNIIYKNMTIAFGPSLLFTFSLYSFNNVLTVL